MQRLLTRLIFNRTIPLPNRTIKSFLSTNPNRICLNASKLISDKNVIIQKRFKSAGNDPKAKLKQNFVNIFYFNKEKKNFYFIYW